MTEEFDISKLICDTLFAADNQMFQCIVTGDEMSYSALSIAHRAAMMVAQREYGDSRRWREVFDYEHNLTVVNPNDSVDVLSRMSNRKIYVFDEPLAVPYVPREDKWRSSIFGAERVYNCCVIITARRTKAVETILRELLGWRVDTLGHNKCRIYRVELSPLAHEPIELSAREFIVESPPKELTDYYDIARANVTHP